MKRKLLILLISLLAAVLCITACTTGPKEEATKTVQSISVVEGSVPAEVNIGTTPDFSGIKVTVTYSDATTKEVGFADVTLSTIDTTTVGNKSVTVTYEGVTTKFTVTVVDPEATAVVTSIKILINENDKTCYIGELFDTSVLQVEATYSTGRQGALSADKYEITAVDTSTAGTKTITATYKEDTAITASVDVKVLGVSALNVVTGTVEKRITVGETLDVSGIQVVPKYEDGVSGEELSYADLVIENIDTSSVGDKTLRITYKGVTLEYTITVVEKSALAVESDSYPKFIDVGSTLDLSGIKAHYTNPLTEESEKNLAFAALTIDTSAVDTSIPGDKEITVSYKGATTTIIIHVRGVESMSVIKPDSKPSELVKGDDLSTVTGGLKLSIVYTTGAPDTINVSGEMLGTFDVNTKGTQDLSITYLNKTISHSIYVKEVVGITVDEDTIGEDLDVSGMEVYAVCDNNTTFKLTDGEIKADFNGVDTGSDGEKTFKVTYDGKYGKFETNVTVDLSLELESLTIKVENTKTRIGYGQLYTNGDVVVLAKYTTGAERELKSGYTIDIDTKTLADTAKLTVSYAKNSEPMTAEIDVTIIKVKDLSISGMDSVVDVGATIDLTYAEVTVTFEDDTKAVVGIGDVEVTKPDTATAGNKALTVSYGGKDVEIPCVVRGIQEIAIRGIGSKVNKGYAIDYLNLMLLITYTNGDTTVKAASDLDGVTYEGTGIAQTVGTMEFVVSYKGLTASKTITVVEENLQVDHISALNKTIPAVVFKDPGKFLSYDTFKLLVYYKNGEVALVPVTDTRVTVYPEKFSLGEAGIKAITFKFDDGTDAVPDDPNLPITSGRQTFDTVVNIWVKGVEKIEIVSGTVFDNVMEGKKLDTSGLQIKATYDDGSCEYVSITDHNLQVVEPNTSVAGKATLTVSYRGATVTMDITVKEPGTVSGIFGVLKPDELSARESYAKNFKDSTSAYRVGDDNPYYFYLNVISLDAKDNIVEIDGKTVPTFARVFLGDKVDETKELKGSDLAKYVKFVSTDNSYDFTEEAVGKTFTIEARPEGAGYESMTKTHTVEVVNGWNIYNAWELNIITNVAQDINGKNQKEIVKSFLSAKGVTRPENLAGVVLHCNLDIKRQDIPADYFCEYVDKNGETQREFYDHFSVFNLGLTASQPTFDIYGNYFSIYSYNLPGVVPAGIANNDVKDPWSSSELFKLKLMYADVTGETAFGCFNENAFNDLKVNIQDIATRDNDPNSNDQTASERHIRGLICFKVGESETNMTNVNIEAYMTSVLVENANSTLNLDKVNFYNAWQGHLFLWNDNFYQRSSWGRNKEKDITDSDIQDLIVNIKDSSLTKCGGPVIIAQSAETNLACNTTNGSQVNVDAASDLHTYVTGQEAWFVATGQTPLAAQIKAMNYFVNGTNSGHGFTSMDKIKGVETINIVMVSMGTGLSIDGSETYNASYLRAGVPSLKMSRPDNKREIFQNPYLDQYKQLTAAENNGVPAPVFQTSGGGIAYSDGKLETGKCLGVQGDFASGKYITLYYMGVGIMMDYYNPSNPE